MDVGILYDSTIDKLMSTMLDNINTYKSSTIGIGNDNVYITAVKSNQTKFTNKYFKPVLTSKFVLFAKSMRCAANSIIDSENADAIIIEKIKSEIASLDTMMDIVITEKTFNITDFMILDVVYGIYTKILKHIKVKRQLYYNGNRGVDRKC